MRRTRRRLYGLVNKSGKFAVFGLTENDPHLLVFADRKVCEQYRAEVLSLNGLQSKWRPALIKDVERQANQHSGLICWCVSLNCGRVHSVVCPIDFLQRTLAASATVKVAA